jgi:hypothetical protein
MLKDAGMRVDELPMPASSSMKVTLHAGSFPHRASRQPLGV